MKAASSALAAGEPDAGYARLPLPVLGACCLLNQVVLPRKRYDISEDPSPVASAKGPRHNDRPLPSPECRSWAYRIRVPRTALVLVCGSLVRKCFVFRRSSLNHRSWISAPILNSCSNCSGCFEKSILLAPQSGRRRSVSVNRYSRPSSQELKSCPERFRIAGSPANATTARPTNNGDSDSRKFRSFFPPSHQVSYVGWTPGLRRSVKTLLTTC